MRLDRTKAGDDLTSFFVRGARIAARGETNSVRYLTQNPSPSVAGAEVKLMLRDDINGGFVLEILSPEERFIAAMKPSPGRHGKGITLTDIVAKLQNDLAGLRISMS